MCVYFGVVVAVVAVLMGILEFYKLFVHCVIDRSSDKIRGKMRKKVFDLNSRRIKTKLRLI